MDVLFSSFLIRARVQAEYEELQTALRQKEEELGESHQKCIQQDNDHAQKVCGKQRSSFFYSSMLFHSLSHSIILYISLCLSQYLHHHCFSDCRYTISAWFKRSRIGERKRRERIFNGRDRKSAERTWKERRRSLYLFEIHSFLQMHNCSISFLSLFLMHTHTHTPSLYLCLHLMNPFSLISSSPLFSSLLFSSLLYHTVFRDIRNAFTCSESIGHITARERYRSGRE